MLVGALAERRRVRLELVQGAPAVNVINHAGVRTFDVTRLNCRHKVAVVAVERSNHIIALEHPRPDICSEYSVPEHVKRFFKVLIADDLHDEPVEVSVGAKYFLGSGLGAAQNCLVTGAKMLNSLSP